LDTTPTRIAYTRTTKAQASNVIGAILLFAVRQRDSRLQASQLSLRGADVIGTAIAGNRILGGRRLARSLLANVQ
jgi:hypothetical protein